MDEAQVPVLLVGVESSNFQVQLRMLDLLAVLAVVGLLMV